MSDLRVTINYMAASSIIKGLRSQTKNLLDWLDVLEDMLDKAATEQKQEPRHIDPSVNIDSRKDHAGDPGSWP